MDIDIKRLEEMETALQLMAEENGLACNYLFTTSFARYKRQMRTLIELGKKCKEVISNGELMVTKGYVKDRENIYMHPVVQQFDRTTDSANKTVATLLKILKSFGVDNAEDAVDPLMDIINGGDADDSQSI